MGNAPTDEDDTVVFEGEDDVYCPTCDMVYLCIDTTWFDNRSLGSAICPECDTEIEVLPEESEPDFYRDDEGVVWRA